MSKSARRDEVASSSNESKFYEDQYDNNGDFVQLGDITDLDSLLGNIVEYKASGDYVAFYNTSKLDADAAAELEPDFFNENNQYQYNNETGLFREVGSKRGGVDVNENSVFFLPTYKDGVEKDELSRGDITKVAVITGDELRGMPTVTTENNGSVWVMQMVSCLQNGIDTVAFAVLDENSTVSDTGTFAYTLSNDYHAKEDEDDEYRVQGVLSNSGSDEMAELLLDHDDVVANKVYRVTENFGRHHVPEPGFPRQGC